ncbi:glycosyltransferase [Leptolyngbya ohadii]|uniref:glycosyltransferase n=1 Tax=Leptolyngbya ohadii TaxID=1962290 RepID=UPI000B59EF89|nr:glycosyltransferase [Leptolyngbya ohadii]
MKRIAFFIPNLKDGGAERVVVNLLKGMSDRGVPLDLVLAQAEGSFLSQVPGNVRIIDLEASRVAKAILPLSRYLQQQKPWALVSHLNYANVATVLAKQIARTKTRLVLVEHNTVSAHKTKVRRFKWVNRLMKLVYPHAEFVVAVSEATSRDLEKYLHFEAGKVRTIYNPVVNRELLIKATAPLNHPWFDRDTPPVFLAAGRLIELKDFSTLIKAFARLRQEKQARLLILGEGELRTELENLAKDLGVAEDVSLPGFVDNPYAYMGRAVAFVLSSRSEGLPNVLIEAMACGCPVISTDCLSGPREILAAGTYGILVPVGDEIALSEAMRRTLEEPPVSENFLMQRAIDLGSFEKATDQYLELIDY